MSNNQFTTVTDNEGDHLDEPQLWKSVIIRLLEDACTPTDHLTDYKRKSSLVAWKRQARAWFTASIGTTAQDFATVCYAANMNPQYVREKALKFIEASDSNAVSFRKLKRQFEKEALENAD